MNALRPPGVPGAALLAAIALAGPCAAEDRFVRPLAAGAFQKFDTATVTLDLPRGIEVVPGTARFLMTSKNTGRTRNERIFPLFPVGRPVALPGGRTRVTLSPGVAQNEQMMRFLREGGRLSRLRLLPGGVSITPAFDLCRTGALSETGAVVVSGKVAIELLPDMPPADIDLRAAAREAGQTLEQHFDPC